MLAYMNVYTRRYSYFAPICMVLTEIDPQLIWGEASNFVGTLNIRKAGEKPSCPGRHATKEGTADPMFVLFTTVFTLGAQRRVTT